MRGNVNTKAVDTPNHVLFTWRMRLYLIQIKLISNTIKNKIAVKATSHARNFSKFPA